MSKKSSLIIINEFCWEKQFAFPAYYIEINIFLLARCTKMIVDYFFVALNSTTLIFLFHRRLLNEELLA